MCSNDLFNEVQVWLIKKLLYPIVYVYEIDMPSVVRLAKMLIAF